MEGGDSGHFFRVKLGDVMREVRHVLTLASLSLLIVADAMDAAEPRAPVSATAAVYRHGPGKQTAAVAVDWTGYRGIRRWPIYGYAGYGPAYYGPALYGAPYYGSLNSVGRPYGPAFAASYYYHRPWYAWPAGAWAYRWPYGAYRGYLPAAGWSNWASCGAWGFRGYSGIGYPGIGGYGNPPGCYVMLGMSEPVGEPIREAAVNSSPAPAKDDDYQGCYYW